MKICVVGAGAIGGLLAFRLAAAGHDVSVVARGAHREAIAARGLTMVDHTAGGRRVAADGRVRRSGRVRSPGRRVHRAEGPCDSRAAAADRVAGRSRHDAGAGDQRVAVVVLPARRRRARRARRAQRRPGRRPAARGRRRPRSSAASCTRRPRCASPASCTTPAAAASSSARSIASLRRPAHRTHRAARPRRCATRGSRRRSRRDIRTDVWAS